MLILLSHSKHPIFSRLYTFFPSPVETAYVREGEIPADSGFLLATSYWQTHSTLPSRRSKARKQSLHLKHPQMEPNRSPETVGMGGTKLPPWKSPVAAAGTGALTKSPMRFVQGKLSSLAPFLSGKSPKELAAEKAVAIMEVGMRMLYAADEGDLDEVREVLDTGRVDVNFRDIDERTALHVAACQGHEGVVEFLIKRGAEVDPKDRWGSTPLADAIYYKKQGVIKLLKKYGAQLPMVPMHAENAPEVPEYEVDPKELDFTNSFTITKGTFRIALWRGTQVAVKVLSDDVIMDAGKIQSFRDELGLLQQLRHPNVVQFLGAVTQSSPMMIITEYLPKGDLKQYLLRKGALKPSLAVKFALDIARGVNYLHQRRAAPIIHRDLEPSNILQDDVGHLKVADFGLSKLQKVAKTEKKRAVAFKEISWRYAAPEVFKNEECDTKVDVFSFALILQEMIEGCPPFPSMSDKEVCKAYCAGARPDFLAPEKSYKYGLKGLIEECWNEKPRNRPSFSHIIKKLEYVGRKYHQKEKWKYRLCGCFARLTKKKGIDGAPSSSHAHSYAL